jgi:hypothetical protein
MSFYRHVSFISHPNHYQRKERSHAFGREKSKLWCGRIYFTLAVRDSDSNFVSDLLAAGLLVRVDRSSKAAAFPL